MSSKHIAIEARSRLVRNICVYCGSVQGAGPSYEAAAQKLGQAMAKAGIGLVYGGGAIGLMGVIARSVLAKEEAEFELERSGQPVQLPQYVAA